MNGDIALRLCRLTATAGRSILILFLICLSTAIASERGVSRDSTRTTIDLRLDSVTTPTRLPLDYTIGALFETGTDDVAHGYGAAIIVDYMRLSPLVLRGGIQLAKSQIDIAELERADVVISEIGADALLHASGSHLRPYAGAGLTFYNVSSAKNDYSGDSAFYVPYDDLFEASPNYGLGVTVHFRMGVKIHVFRRASICLDSKYTVMKPHMQLEMVSYTSGSRLREVGYDMDRLSITLGLTLTEQ